MARLALLSMLLAGARAADKRCTRSDMTGEASPSPLPHWTLHGCSSLNLTCADASREAPCNNSLGKGEISALVAAIEQSGQSLAAIDLRGNWLGPFGAALLSKALASHPTLTTLSIASCRVGDYGVLSLVKELLSSAPAVLAQVDLSHNSISDVGARELSVLLERETVPSLSHLDLSWNGIGPRGARYLGAALASNGHLRSLDLNWNGLMDRGARAIGESLADNTGLTYISLEHNAIKNDGARALAQGLRKNSGVKEILLDSNGITRSARQEVISALEATPEVQTSPFEDGRDDSGDIEEISFDDDAEEEAPQASAVEECVDHGPWKCVEQNCPSANIDCTMLAELGLCDSKFDEIWEEAPPRGIGGLRAWEQCRKACMRCD
ncbi:MAG: hypothetical protein SGPRY_008725 [Prymnesium sp.]